MEQRPGRGRPDYSPSAGSMSQLDVKVEIMRAAGLENDEILRLSWLKMRMDNGLVDDLTIEHKRLTFLKFLHESGRIKP